MSGNWLVDLTIALIGCAGLVISGWMTYKGALVGKDPSPEITDHSTPASEASKTRDFVARSHEETRRQMREEFREMRASHDGMTNRVIDVLARDRMG